MRTRRAGWVSVRRGMLRGASPTRRAPRGRTSACRRACILVFLVLLLLVALTAVVLVVLLALRPVVHVLVVFIFLLYVLLRRAQPLAQTRRCPPPLCHAEPPPAMGARSLIPFVPFCL